MLKKHADMYVRIAFMLSDDDDDLVAFIHYNRCLFVYSR